MDFQVAPDSSHLMLSDSLYIPSIAGGYTIWLPDSLVSGSLVFFHSRRDSSSDFLIDYANLHGLAVVYVTTDHPLDFLASRDRKLTLEAHLHQAVTKYELPGDKLLFCGMSLAGTRAVLMSRFGDHRDSNHAIRPMALAICDAPLDMIRFYHSMKRAKANNYHPAAANEGAWVSRHLELLFGGDPTSAPQSFASYSPFTHSMRHSLDLSFLDNVHVRAYTEPDVQWWMKTRRKDYYDMNAIDMAGLINELMLRGHTSARLLTTDSSGFRPDGTRHPHSWSIVDERALVRWFINLLESSEEVD